MQELHPTLNGSDVPAPQKSSAQPAAASIIAVKTGPVATGFDEEKPVSITPMAFRYTDWADI